MVSYREYTSFFNVFGTFLKIANIFRLSKEISVTLFKKKRKRSYVGNILWPNAIKIEIKRAINKKLKPPGN